jgi:predicted peptidase
MKRILFILLLFASSAQAQLINWFVGSPTVSGTNSGAYPMAGKLWRPPDLTKKYPCVGFLHGIGERTNAGVQWDTINSSGTNRLANTSPMGLLTSPSGRLVRQFVQPDGTSTYFVFVAPQLANKFNTWDKSYIREFIAWAKRQPYIDSNRIYLTGLSLGGGGTYVASHDSLINIDLAGAAPICPGYYNNMNFPFFNRSGLRMWIFHAVNDGTASYNTWTVGYATQVIAGNPVASLSVTAMADGDHGSIVWDRAYDPATWTAAPFLRSDGDVIDFTDTYNLFTWFLRGTKNKRPIGY